MADYLPQDLLIDIFMRLPTETLVRVAFVCKSWNFLITSPKFISHHLHRNADDRLLLVRYRTYDETKTGEESPWPWELDEAEIDDCSGTESETESETDQYCSETEHYSLVVDGNDSFRQLKSLDLPFDSKGYSIVGSVNGVICLSDDMESGYSDDIFLWNPSIRKFVALPKYNVRFQSHGPFMHCLGFGFDPRTNDFKVVRVVQTGFFSDSTPLVEIYTHKTGCWRFISDKALLPLSIMEKCRQAYVNGTANWMAFTRPTPLTPVRNRILSFNMCDEVFKEILVPYSITHEDSYAKRMILVAFKESLCLIQQCIYDAGAAGPHCTGWIMKEYGVPTSWSTLFRINLSGGLGRPLGLRENGEVIFATSDGELVSCDHKSRHIKYLGIRGTFGDGYSHWHTFYTDIYIESLELLNKVGKSRKYN